MASKKHINRIVHMGMHVFILFCFLTVLFFVYISKIETKTSRDVVTNLIDKNTPTLLSKIDYWDIKLNKKSTIDWQSIKESAEKMKAQYQGELPEIKKSNDRLRTISIIVIVSLFVLLIGLILYFKVYKKYKVDVLDILKENALVFLLVAGIEVLFFTYVASQYIPTTPSDISDMLLNRVKYNIDKS